MLGYGGGVLWIVAAVQDAAVDFGMQRLNAAVEHLREASEFGDVFDFYSRVAQKFCGASGGDDFDAECGEFAGEFGESGFIGDAEDGALDAGRHAGASNQNL